MTTNITVQNAGMILVVDFDCGTTSAIPRQDGTDVADVVPQNGLVIHLNGNNDD
tara:strand:- start:444 stop:605 length:162 start_codon:yes stop_codon:yes gene_type:complete